MQAFTFISKSLLLLSLLLASPIVLAQANNPEDYDTVPRSEDEPKEHDFLGNAWTEYGDFQDKEEEADLIRFFQHGRFFGVSAGTGLHSVTGERGALWEGGFPSIAIRLHYWFNFFFGLHLEFSNATHSYNVSSTTNAVTNVNLTQFGAHLRYMVNTRDLSAALTFARPYLFVGGGLFNKSETSLVGSGDSDRQFGLSGGTGLEFLIQNKKIYLDTEVKLDFVNYNDRLTPPDGSGLSTLNGIFYTLQAHLKFTY